MKAIKESHANVGFGPLCMLFGKSRYAFYKKDKNRQRWLNEDQTVLEMVAILRRELPRIGTSKLYHMLKKPLQDHHIKMGRDTLHRLLCGNGLAIRPKRRYVVTTDSRHWMKKYPNLVKDLVVSESEQEWVSDITYIQVGEGFDFFVYINPKVPHSSIEKYTTKSTMNGNFPFIKYGQYVYKTRDNNQEPS